MTAKSQSTWLVMVVELSTRTPAAVPPVSLLFWHANGLGGGAWRVEGER